MVRILRASQAPCVPSLHPLYSRAADKTCRHPGPSRKCPRTKLRLASCPLGSRLPTFEAARVHRFGARQEGFAPQPRPLRAQAADIPGRSMPDARAYDQRYPPEPSHRCLRTQGRPWQPRPRLRCHKTTQRVNHFVTFAQHQLWTSSLWKAGETSGCDRVENIDVAIELLRPVAPDNAVSSTWVLVRDFYRNQIG